MIKPKINPKHARQLERVMQVLEINAYELAEVLEYKQANTVYHITKGRQNMSVDFMTRLCRRFPTINLSYLKDGKGNVELSDKLKVNQMNMLREKVMTPEEELKASLRDLHLKMDMILKLLHK